MIPRLPLVLFMVLAVPAAGVGSCGAERPAGQETPPAREGPGLRLDEQNHLVPPPFPIAEPFEDHAALRSLDPVLQSDRLSVAVEGTAFRQGDRIRLSVRYRGVPAGAGLKLELVRDVGLEARGLFPGWTGPLDIRLTPVSGNGEWSFGWPASEVACAPTDTPMMCGPVTPGRYRLLATVVERSDFLTVGWPPRPYPAVLDQAHSTPFTIGGARPLDAFDLPMRTRGIQHMQAAVGTIGWSDDPRHPLLIRSGAIQVRTQGVCADWISQPPFTGRLRTCTPLDVLTSAGLRVSAREVEVKGQVRWAPGVIPYEEAALAALAAARRPYLDRVRPKEGTRLIVGLPRSAFRADLSAWVIRVSVVEGYGPETVTDRFNDEVTVCVNARTAAARVIEARPRSTLDVHHWPGPCPA